MLHVVTGFENILINKIMKNKYRIVRDSYAWYECQIKYWWFPLVWLQLHNWARICNTHKTIANAEKFIENYKKNWKAIKYID